jgi:hypothetical protein
VWDFVAPAGSFVEVDFAFIQLEDRWDFLNFHPSPSEHTAFSGFAEGVRYSSTGNTLRVAFTSDYSVVREGWDASVTAVSARCDFPGEDGWCGGGNETGSSDDGTDPYHCSYEVVLQPGESALSTDGLGQYSNDQECMQRFTAPDGYFLQMEFHQFDLEFYFDRLTLFSDIDPAQALVLTGLLEPYQHAVVSRDNTLNVYFRSDVSVVREGWAAAVTVVSSQCDDPDGDGFCGGDPTEPIVYGCTDVHACNFNPAATMDDMMCWYAMPGRDCYRQCLQDVNRNNICDEYDHTVITDCQSRYMATEVLRADGVVYTRFCNMYAGQNCDVADNHVNGLPVWRVDISPDNTCGFMPCPNGDCYGFGSGSGSDNSTPHV